MTSRYVLLAAIYGVGVILPSIILGNYWAGLLVLAFLYAIVAINTDIVWGYAGIITFASAAMFGIGAYALGMMFVHVSSSLWAMAIAVIAGMLAAGVLSALIGWLVFYSRTKVSEFYVAVVTLGITLSFNQIVLYGGAVTGGSNGLSGFSTIPITDQSWYFIAGTLLFGATLSALRVVGSDFGLVLRAIRDNETRCRYLGIRTPFIKAATFCCANSAIAAAGVCYALFTTLVAPSLAGMLFATNILIWVILGGRGSIIGPAFAAIVLTAATPFLSTTIPLYWRGILGGVFVLVVMFLPQGVFSAIWAATGGKPPFSQKPKRAVEQGAAQTVPFDSAAREDILCNAARARTDGEVVLAVNRVSKRFGSFQALREMDLSVRRGELISVVGPNGAGKTSFVRCISDGEERSSGTVTICGQDLERRPPELVAAMGVGRKFQAPSIFEKLTVGECLRIASWKGTNPSIWAQNDEIDLPSGAAEVVSSLGLTAVWDTLAGSISHGQRQALELAMVLALEPVLLVLDEPTAGLSTAERAKVGEVLQRLVARKEVGMILIEHDFEFVKRVSSRIVVLVGGEVVADGTVAEVANSDLVKDAYLGRTEKEMTT